MKEEFDISVVLGSKNRKNLLKSTIKSVRDNGFKGEIEIIVVDGGSTDGTSKWLARQKDILTIIQPNYNIIDSENVKCRAHSWGEFMNIGFKYAHSDYIVMISDDLILAEGCLQNGYNEIKKRIENGEKIGAAAFYFREFPRHDYFRVGILPNDYITLNHGFYYKKALNDVDFLDEVNYNFYYADSDVIMRLNFAGWKTIALDNCFALHLCHKPKLRKKALPAWYIRDCKEFNAKYGCKTSVDSITKNVDVNINYSNFIKYAPINYIMGLFLRIYDKYRI